MYETRSYRFVGDAARVEVYALPGSRLLGAFRMPPGCKRPATFASLFFDPDFDLRSYALPTRVAA